MSGGSRAWIKLCGSIAAVAVLALHDATASATPRDRDYWSISKPDVIAVEGTYSEQTARPSNGKRRVSVVIERRLYGDDGVGLTLYRMDRIDAGQIVIDDVLKGDDLPDALVVKIDGNPPPRLVRSGAKVRAYFMPETSRSGILPQLCPLDSFGPPTRGCDAYGRAIALWQENVRLINEAVERGDVAALVAKAEELVTEDLANTEKALRSAIEKGGLREAGPKLARILVREHRYSEATVLLDRVLAIGGTSEPDLGNLREVARAAAGLPFDSATVDFSGHRLKGLRLTDVSLPDRRFDSARWQNVTLSGVDLSGLRSNLFSLSVATLDRVTLRGAQIPPDDLASFFLFLVTIRDSDLSGADLRRAHMSSLGGSGETTLDRTRIERSRFDNSNLAGAGFYYAQMEDVSFATANLKQANFSNARMNRVSFARASLAAALLKDTELYGVDFSTVVRERVDSKTRRKMRYYYSEEFLFDPVVGATWRNARYDCATRWPPGFRPARYGMFPVDRKCANGSAVDYSGLDLTEAALVNLDLSNASFRGTRIEGHCRATSMRRADFTGAKLLINSAPSCDFSGAIFRRANVLVPLAEATLDGAHFVDATIHAYSLLSLWNHYWKGGPDRVSELPGARFTRSRIVCTDQNFWTMGSRFHAFHPQEMTVALQNLRKRGARIDRTCRKHYPDIGAARS